MGEGLGWDLGGFMFVKWGRGEVREKKTNNETPAPLSYPPSPLFASSIHCLEPGPIFSCLQLSRREIGDETKLKKTGEALGRYHTKHLFPSHHPFLPQLTRAFGLSISIVFVCGKGGKLFMSVRFWVLLMGVFGVFWGGRRC